MNCLSPALSALTPLPMRRLGIRPLSIALLNLGLLLLPGAAMPQRVLGAERLYITYGSLDFAVPISELEDYAKTGKIGKELAFYTRFLNENQRSQFRRALLARVNVTPVAVAQFLYSSIGETLLRRAGEIIQTKANQSGFYAVRAALILSAASPEGLTPLNVLKNFPTYGIRINSERGLQTIAELTNQIRQTQAAIATVETQSLSAASTQNPVNLFGLPDLRNPGLVKWNKQTITINNIARRRVFPVDIYLPQVEGRAARLIVISHGLGSDRDTFKYLAAHLASYGFAVAVPEHPGSSARQLEQLTTGFSSVVTPALELIDRPLDVKDLLDELTLLFPGRLNLQQVGIIGQSFGGYTALALAGAKLNFEQVQKDCLNSQNSLNVSLLLQCKARILPPGNYNLQDDRIKAAIAINPVTSSLFGEAGMSNIKIPVMMVASSADTVAPALSEQIQPFTWLTTPNKYLVLLKGGTHFSTLLEPADAILPLPERALGPSPQTARKYMQALSLAFFKTYIAGEPAYQPYLSAAYARTISETPLPLSLVPSLTSEQLTGERDEPTPSPR